MNRKTLITILSLTFLSLLISAFILDDEIKSFCSIEEGINGFLLSIRFFFMNALLIGISIYSIVQLLKKRTFGYLFPISVCLIHFAIVITLRIKLNLRESSPIILKAHYYGEINGLTLDLRENKTYKLSDFGFFGGTTHYGEYRMIGDTILLSKKNPLGEDRDIMSNKLVMEKELILIKPDSNGIYNKNEFIKLQIVKQHTKF